jgi:hypothetical protein
LHDVTRSLLLRLGVLDSIKRGMKRLGD